MKRPAKASVAVAGALLVIGLTEFLVQLPSLYAIVKQDRSFPALSRYVFERTPGVVLVGSSMTYRVMEGYFLKSPVRNIAISGGSPLTGLAIVGSYSSIPHLAMVEVNIMSRPIDHGLLEQFGKSDAAPYQWFRPFRAVISLVYYWIKTKSVADDVAKLPQLPPSDYDIAASVESAAREYGASNLDEAIAKNVAAIKPMVEELERRGCHVVFYELPYPGQLGDYHFAVLTRTLMHATFPDPKNWPEFDFHRSELRWVDSAHMDERSAIIVAKEIERYIASSPAAF
ncbi:hypothetical protein SAMN05444159_1989 [Bradyrhizobium lablabi]|uniref:SGNH/GDSL hydrolase family protein n=1 Tax=Bradyrhizobium lablabi TaxID=722472 RepID=A0A1M6NGR5_9BRAD|nr:hypothetical protein [Bradyrhizobium lablabi]SHJ94813.1 hypothetical protein SAMN05444159_1989 [Bradyrhizobium lablabi]